MPARHGKALAGTKLDQLLGDMLRARDLTEQERYEDARQMYQQLRAECQRAGIHSAHVAWGLAVVCDGLGDFDAAMKYIREALDLDPLAIPYRRSFAVIVERVREVLGSELRDPADPETPRLYELLVQVGEGDVRSHLGMARYLHHAGENTRAMKILDAVTTLAPASRAGWLLKAAVARALGDAARAADAELEATAIEVDDRSAGALAKTKN